MDWMFLGTTSARTDAKARLSVPAAFRRQLEERGDARIVLAPSLTEPAIQCFPLSGWMARLALVAALPQSDPVVRLVKKTQFAMASEVLPDGHGRVLVPAELRAHADIDVSADVAIVGQGGAFELWNAARWQAESARALAEVATQVARLAELGL